MSESKPKQPGVRIVDGKEYRVVQLPDALPHEQQESPESEGAVGRISLPVPKTVNFDEAQRLLETSPPSSIDSTQVLNNYANYTHLSRKFIVDNFSLLLDHGTDKEFLPTLALVSILDYDEVFTQVVERMEPMDVVTDLVGASDVNNADRKSSYFPSRGPDEQCEMIAKFLERTLPVYSQREDVDIDQILNIFMSVSGNKPLSRELMGVIARNIPIFSSNANDAEYVVSQIKNKGIQAKISILKNFEYVPEGLINPEELLLDIWQSSAEGIGAVALTSTEIEQMKLSGEALQAIKRGKGYDGNVRAHGGTL